MNIVEHVSLMHAREYSGYMPRRGIAGFCRSVMPRFLRNHQTDFQSGCSILQSHQQWKTVPLSPHPCQQLLSPEFLTLPIMTGVRWNLRVVLICISLMINDVEHFLRYFSARQSPSCENSENWAWYFLRILLYHSWAYTQRILQHAIRTHAPLCS